MRIALSINRQVARSTANALNKSNLQKTGQRRESACNINASISKHKGGTIP